MFHVLYKAKGCYPRVLSNHKTWENAFEEAAWIAACGGRKSFLDKTVKYLTYAEMRFDRKLYHEQAEIRFTGKTFTDDDESLMVVNSYT